MTRFKIRSVLRSAASGFFRTLSSFLPHSDSDLVVFEPEIMTNLVVPRSVDPEVLRIRVEDLQEDDVLIETWAGVTNAMYADDAFPLVPGLVLFIHVGAVADGDEGVEVLNSAWTHFNLPDDPINGPVSATVHEGVNVYPRGTPVTILRGVTSIPVAELFRGDQKSGTHGPS